MTHATERMMGDTQKWGCWCGTMKAPMKLRPAGWPWAESGTVGRLEDREKTPIRQIGHVAMLGEPKWCGRVPERARVAGLSRGSSWSLAVVCNFV